MIKLHHSYITDLLSSNKEIVTTKSSSLSSSDFNVLCGVANSPSNANFCSSLYFTTRVTAAYRIIVTYWTFPKEQRQQISH